MMCYIRSLLLLLLLVALLLPGTGIMYAIDAKFSILIKIMATDGPLTPVTSGGPTIVLEADVLEGPVSNKTYNTIQQLR